MKKSLILLVSVLLITAIIYFWQQKATSLTPQPMGVVESVIPKITEPSSESEFNAADNLGFKPKAIGTQEVFGTVNVASQSREECTEAVNKKYPGIESKFSEIMSNLYSDGEMAAGSSPYQTMPTQSLNSLAAANDVNALYVLGSEIVWLAATGIMINQHSDMPVLTSDEKNTIAKNHKVDFDLLQEGEDYLFRAAVLGKIGALFEFSSLGNMAISQLSKSETESEKVKELLAKVSAYSKLALEVHRDDELLKTFFEGTLQGMEQRSLSLFSGREGYETLESDIDEMSAREFALISKRWKTEREYHGLPAYPKFLTRDLEQYGREIQVCWNLTVN